MHDIHLSRELLRAVSGRELPAQTLVEIGLDHLRQLCPHCAAEWKAWQKERLGELPTPERTMELLPIFLATQLPKLAAQEKLAAEDFRALQALSPEARTARIERARSRFQSPALVHQLVHEARRLVRREAKAAHHFAELAYQVARRIPGSQPYGLMALALAEMANAARVCTGRQLAGSCFTQARELIQSGGVTDPGVIARVDHLEASLCLDQRRFREGEELLLRSRMLYQLVGGEVETVKVEITLAFLHLERGSPAKAVRTARQTLKRPAVREDPALFFQVRINLARALADLRQFEQVTEILDQDEPLHQRLAEPLMQLRYPWIRAKIAAAQGDLATAESLFRSVRDAFLAAGIGYDAAMVSLDLALAYVRTGHWRRTRRLAEEMIGIFLAEDVHREALAALRLFQEAARNALVSERFLEELVGYLKAARTDDTLAFEPSA